MSECFLHRQPTATACGGRRWRIHTEEYFEEVEGDWGVSLGESILQGAEKNKLGSVQNECLFCLLINETLFF